MNNWEKVLGVKYPACNMCGKCCRMASPSSPVVKMLEKAANGNQIARDFFNLFIPYITIEDIQAIPLSHIEKSKQLALKSPKFPNNEEVIFFYCRFISDDNKCLIHEDRPELCRDYPDTPFIVMPPNCAYEEWSKECKKKYYKINSDLEILKNTQNLLVEADKIINRGLSLYYKPVISPVISWIK